jgi:putative SOS response-associated peptidase YedK
MKIRKMTLNAKSETVFSLPSFRKPILSKRCLLPSTGYFEFHHAENEVIPYYIFLKNEKIFSIGAIFEIWQNPVTNENMQTFSVLTVPANELCAKIHNGGKNPFRMPLIIDREQEEHWLDMSLNNSNIKRFFEPYNASEMDAYSITKDFIKKSSKDVTIIQKAA